MKVLKEIKNLETEGRRLIVKAERDGEKRLAEAKKMAVEAKNKAIADANAQAEKIVEEGRERGRAEAEKIHAKTDGETEKIKAAASKKSTGSKKTIFKRLLDV